MKRNPVKPSQIAAIGYDPKTQTLEIEFKSGQGGVYQYKNVGTQIFTDLMGEGKEGHSVGSYFIRNIKQRPDLHPFKKIEDAAAKKA